MGLGHQRAAHPLAHLAAEGIITAGDSSVTDPGEARLWGLLRRSYEFLSRVRHFPVGGALLFGLMDRMLRIPAFYPLRDLSSPALNNHLVDFLIRRGLGRTLMLRLRAQRLPMVSTFYAPSLVADHFHYPEVYSVICDADLNRVWVATRPRDSTIRYFAPCGRVMRRLRSYGVPGERIFITGFPLPTETIGGPGMEVLRGDLLARLDRLDPRRRFMSVFGASVERLLGPLGPAREGRGAVTVTFAVGGAGAQVEIGQQLAQSLREEILEGRFRLNLVAGVNRDVERRFTEHLARIGLTPDRTDGVLVLCEDGKPEYFDRFADLLRTTDVLWTKPSELSFSSALGIPIVVAPTIGAQEDKNQKWLMDKGCALPQYVPTRAAEWLRDMVRDGVLAEKAFSGFVKNRKLGVYKIEEVLSTGTMARETHPLRR
jgi:hypothetical protein